MGAWDAAFKLVFGRRGPARPSQVGAPPSPPQQPTHSSPPAPPTLEVQSPPAGTRAPTRTIETQSSTAGGYACADVTSSSATSSRAQEGLAAGGFVSSAETRANAYKKGFRFTWHGRTNRLGWLGYRALFIFPVGIVAVVPGAMMAQGNSELAVAWTTFIGTILLACIMLPADVRRLRDIGMPPKFLWLAAAGPILPFFTLYEPQATGFVVLYIGTLLFVPSQWPADASEPGSDPVQPTSDAKKMTPVRDLPSEIAQPSSNQVPGTGDVVRSRLETLEELRRNGLLSEDEYSAKRAEIIAGL